MIRGVARRLLGVTFVVGGVEALRDTDRRASRARDVGLDSVADPQTVARAFAGAQVAAGTLLVLGRFQRLSSLALAATLVPDSLTVHAFWTEHDKQDREVQRTMFVRDIGLLGGLLVSAGSRGRRTISGKAVKATRKATKKAVGK